MSRETKPLDLGEDYRKVLNRHGYAFQYGVIKLIDDLNRQGRIDWELEATEFPVGVGGMDSIFRKTRPHIYLIGECKRVNPALSNWCFAGSVYSRGSSRLDKLIFEYAWVPSPDKKLTETLSRTDAIRMLTGTIQHDFHRVYHLGLSVRSNKTGDKSGKNTDAIEEAAGQVCKGLNGLIEYFNSQHFKLPADAKFYFLPAIFTTARIWTTDVDLSSANIDKGEFEFGLVPLKETAWIWYQYHVSPALKHTVSTDEESYVSPFELARILDQDFTRSIAIVNVKGIDDFLHHGFPWR